MEEKQGTKERVGDSSTRGAQGLDQQWVSAHETYGWRERGKNTDIYAEIPCRES